ncbi:PKD domain-containing protein [Microbacterium atlanticum]|uniref:PKD domain-containing protein n=1 Tax=Microbacterium atlanticum TaxID=2782168 RepID=UPI0018891781|nr:PKD domain-containing protein [Microbacterium atlanticum]
MARPSFARPGPIAASAVLALTVALLPALPAAAEPVACVQPAPNAPMQVTADCIDPTYTQPVIDAETDETTPVPHHRVSGHFEGTNITFNIYLHPAADKSKWQGRFFQYTYPTTFSADQNTSRASDRAIGFALASGGYAVQAGNGFLSLGYRHTAAAAKFAETVAAAYYGSDRAIFGYLYGPSGGSFQTVGAAENTDGVWQGFVPLVQAVPTPNSYNFNGRAAAELILADKADEIRDALLPGGSGDPYATLDEAERAMLTEVHKLGIPWKGWENPDYLLGYDPAYFGGGLDSDDPLVYDPTFVDDFWNTAGYLGAEDSPLGERVRAELVEMGDTIGHRWNIAKRFAYRYQLPAAGTGWIALDQFRAADGTPLYPQRTVGEPGFSGAVSGNAAFDGSINGKMIVVSNLYDVDALPIHTDWYRKKVESSLGAAAGNAYRVYYTDHADHQDAAPTGARAATLVDWYGSVEQALRDVAAWAEKGVAAPVSTRYEIKDSQIVVSPFALVRAGIQPTVDFVTLRDGVITTRVGKPVALLAAARAPLGGGKIVAAEWDFEGDGTYVAGNAGKPQKIAALATTHRFTQPGTYFVSVRVTAERNGDVNAGFARVQNIDRVRVVVTQ